MSRLDDMERNVRNRDDVDIKDIMDHRAALLPLVRALLAEHDEEFCAQPHSKSLATERDCGECEWCLAEAENVKFEGETR